MEEKDERVDLIQRFTVNSLRLDPDSWRDFVLEEENQVVFTGFFKSKDFKTMFINRDSEGRLKVSFQFPENVQSKVICVSKTVREAVSEENIRDSLTVQEIHGEDAMTVTASVCQQVTCPLLGSLAEQQPISWAAGEGDESQTIMERQKTATQVMRAQIEGRIFLPHPAALQDASYYDNCVGGELSPACDTTIVEWAEFVSEFLKENSSEVVLKGLKPFPSEEFNFWMKRRNNLCFLQEQLQSSRAQQVAAVVQQVDSVLWFTLQDIYRDVEESLREAEEVSQALRPLQETLEQVEQVEYQQLELIVEAVIERVHQVQIQSQFYRNPDTLLVLLTQICNLFIQRSRDFLRREEVMRGLVSNPGQVLDVRQVIQTLQTLRKAFTEIQNQEQGGVTLSSDSHPADFMDLENVLIHLHSIKEVVFVTLQLSPLDQVVLSGANGSMFTVQVQDLYQDFLHHLKVLSESNCDPTDPEDQNLQIHVDQFLVQVSDQATRLVSLLSRGLEDCCESSSVVQLVQMFWFLLDRPLIRDLLPSLLVRVEVLVLEELDQIEQLFQSQRGDPEVFRGSRSRSSTVAQICWTHQLERRTEEVLKNYRTIQNLWSRSGGSQVVLQRFRDFVNQLQVLRTQVCSDWTSQLDLDCRFILDQPLVQWDGRGVLVIGCSQKLLSALRDLRYLNRMESDMKLRPQAARLLTCRDDITQSYLLLSHLVSCYNQVLNDALQVELPLIQDQLQDLNQDLSELQRNTWSCPGVQHLVEQKKERVMIVVSTVNKARANMDAMTHLIQGWAGLHLLQCRSGDSVLEGGANEQSRRLLREDGQQLLNMIQVNRSLYRAEESSESWTRYLDHIQDQVQEGLLQMMFTTLQQLCDRTDSQSGAGVLLAVSLTLQETDGVFEPSLGGDLSDHLNSVITDAYAAAGELPRISVSRHGNYQVCLQQHPALCQLEQEVMQHLTQVKKEAEHLRAGLNRYSHLWESDKMAAMEEFLTYGRQLGPEELEADVTPPTIKDYRREVEVLHTLSTEVTHLDDVITLNSWLQVDLRPFRESLLSIIYDWKHLYTEQLLTSLTDSLQQVRHRGNDDDEEAAAAALSSPLRFPLTETVVLLESAGVTLPEHLSAQLQEVMSL